VAVMKYFVAVDEARQDSVSLFLQTPPRQAGPMSGSSLWFQDKTIPVRLYYIHHVEWEAPRGGHWGAIGVWSSTRLRSIHHGLTWTAKSNFR